MANDAIVLPSVSRSFDSPSGAFHLSIISPDEWKTPRAIAALSTNGHALWHRVLPQEKGPRIVLVADDGTTVLFDEWINVASKHALMVIGPDNKVVAHIPFDQIVETLGVPRRAMTENAKIGPWLSTMPALSADGATATFRAGGHGMSLSLADGKLSVTD